MKANPWVYSAEMKPTIFVLTLVLTVGNLAHCQEWENLLFIKMEEVLGKQEAALNQLTEMQEKQEHIADKLHDVQGKLEHVENNLQELHHEMEHLKGTAKDNQNSLLMVHQETKECLRRDDLADECSEGSHNCGDYETCTDKLVNFTCSCLPGFARNGSLCEDIDECTQGKAECSPHATCRNYIGSYSCSCNPPFEGDGRTCEFLCKSPNMVFEGLGCVRYMYDKKTWHQMNATCREAGWRLLQEFDVRHLQDVHRAFPDIRHLWIGVYDGKWLESGIPLQEEVWKKDSWGCGLIQWDSKSSSYKFDVHDCSSWSRGFCHFGF